MKIFIVKLYFRILLLLNFVLNEHIGIQYRFFRYMFLVKFLGRSINILYMLYLYLLE